MDVLDFQAEIAAAEHGVYEVTLRGPDGAETSSRTRLPLPADQLRALVARIPDSVIASSARVRRSASPDEQPVQLLGRGLYDMLTAGDGRALLAAARHAAARAEAQLRLVLRVRPPELAFLPWEFLFDAAHSGYVCTTTPLIRHPQVAVPQRPLRVDPPLRVLCMISRPGDQETLAVEAERQRLGAALEGLRRDGLIELGWVGGETWRALKTALRRGSGPWHVFHFIGHGGFDRAAGEGTLALDDGAGGTYQLGAENLAMVLQGQPSLRLVVLNACETGRASSVDPFSSVGGALMRAGLPAALVMQYPISDQAAVELSQSFYEELAQGRTVDAAVTEARQSVRLALPGTLEWGTPVLYMRSLDGMLFAIDQGRAPVTRATQVGDLYVQGLAALYTHRWNDAVAAFRGVLAQDRGYENAAVKLEEALRGRRLDHLYTAAVGAAEAGQWTDAAAHLSVILTEDPDYRDARERLAVARTRAEVASLRAEARSLHAAGQWEAVLAVGERLAALVPGDADPDGVVAEARRRAEEERGRAERERERRHPPWTPGPRKEAAAGREAGGAAGASGSRKSGREAGVSGSRGEVPPGREGPGGPGTPGLREGVVSGWEAGRTAGTPGPRGEAAPERESGRAAGASRRGEEVPGGSGASGSREAVRGAGSSGSRGEQRPPVREAARGSGSPDSRAAARAPRTPGPREETAPVRESARASGAPGRAVRLATSTDAWSVALARDGGRVAVGGKNGWVRVFDLQEWRSARVWPGFRGFERTVGGPVRALAFAPDGRRIAVGHGAKVVLREAADQSRVVEFQADRHDVTALTYCGDDMLAAASRHSVGLWSLDRPTRLRTLDHEDAVYALAVTGDATRLATAGHSHVRVWDIGTGEPTVAIDYHPMVFAADFSPDGTRLVTGALDHTVRVWDTTTGDCLTRLQLPDRVRGVAHGPDGTTLAIAAGHTVNLIDLTTGRTLLELADDFGDVTLLQIAYSPDGTHLATVGGGKAWLIPLREKPRD